MAQSLLLRLPPSRADDTEWLSLSDGGEPSTARQRGPLALAAAVGRASSVIVLAPATQILLAEPELPPGSGPKLARAVPFALEEQLTEDIDQLVFALGKRRASGGTPVAVVSRKVLQAWLGDLNAAGIDPVAIYADMSLLPDNPGQTVLWYEHGRLSVRRPGKLPFAVELTPVTEALIVAGLITDPLERTGVNAPGATADLTEALESATLESAILYVTREDWATIQAEIESLVERFASLKIQLLPDGPLPWLARDLRATDAVNLLQGEFARTTNYGGRLKPWRNAALLAVALLVIHVAAQAFQLHRAKLANTALDAQITEVYSGAMSGEPLQNPRHQMQVRLDRIRHSGAGPQYFLRAMQTLSGALVATPKINIGSLSYREDTLEMKVTAPSLAELSQLSRSVAKQGFTAEIQSSTPVGSEVEAHLQLRLLGAKAHR